MELRELLQKEVWSKRTSRKILVGFGLVFGILVVGTEIWAEAMRHWISPPERNAAKAALAKIDALQDFNRLSDREFEVAEKQARAKVDEARRSTRTFRDIVIATEVSGYLFDTEMERLSQRHQTEWASSSSEWLRKMASQESQEDLRTRRYFTSKNLHTVLGN